jgi:hypothetical protein
MPGADAGLGEEGHPLRLRNSLDRRIARRRGQRGIGASRLAAALALAAAGLAEPVAAAAPPTRTEDQRLVTMYPPLADGRFGAAVSMTQSLPVHAAVGASRGGLGGGSVDGFHSTDGISLTVHFGDEASGDLGPCPVDFEDGPQMAAALHQADHTGTIFRHYNGVSSYIVEGIAGPPIEAIALDGDTVVVGQPSFSSSRGRILVYELGDGIGDWDLVASFEGVTAGERLGKALDISGDLIVAGAPTAGANTNGAVRTYIDTGSWIPWLSIDSPAEAQTVAWFGASLELAPGGGRLVVGSPFLDRFTFSGTVQDTGAAYVFEPTLLGWELTALLRPSGASASDQFGSGVALHGDIVVGGSPGEADGPGINTVGAAYVFQRFGSTWQETFRLRDSAASPGSRLGASVAVGEAGALVGAPSTDVAGVLDQGVALLYRGIELIFADGFESGDTSAWSSAVP